ncbi:MAG: SDR family oxidoreductase [Acetobacteraceae bacterium]|nr:SDR family oxidoreductase [Acetobacteraceae bacterium]MBV8526053.1 SDR family oxidoreductase [Acetobacteraceae bacterium]MBV8590400.1 SDR family oxidoreductase [Acetobacteraceae bacterium]
MKTRDLRNAVVVITGASSGIGRAAALAFARKGARLALAARRSRVLDEVAAECRQLGVPAIAVPTDVTDPEAVENLAEQSIVRFGRIDVWINNAGVGAVGSFTETPVESHDQVIRTNLIGYVHGAHAALRRFIRQRSGVLINTISFGAWVPAPFAAAYAASKFGLRGLSESLRAEVQRWPDIHICDLYPSFMDTPGVQHGANYTGRVLKPAPPVYSPERAAGAMVSLAENPQNATTIGAIATLAKLGYDLAPSLTRWAADRFIRLYLQQAKPAPKTEGNLFHPIPEGTGTTGGWRSPGERAAVVTGLVVAVVVGGLLLLGQRRTAA